LHTKQTKMQLRTVASWHGQSATLQTQLVQNTLQMPLLAGRPQGHTQGGRGHSRGHQLRPRGSASWRQLQGPPAARRLEQNVHSAGQPQGHAQVGRGGPRCMHWCRWHQRGREGTAFPSACREAKRTSHGMCTSQPGRGSAGLGNQQQSGTWLRSPSRARASSSLALMRAASRQSSVSKWCRTRRPSFS
jgi:hypothetical protein